MGMFQSHTNHKTGEEESLWVTMTREDCPKCGAGMVAEVPDCCRPHNWKCPECFHRFRK